MQIIGVNPHRTKSARDISFMVYPEPEPEVLNKIDMGPLRLEFEDGYLQVTVPKSEAVIGAQIVKAIQAEYAEALRRHHGELEAADRKRQSMLLTVTQNTGVQLMKDS